MKEENVFIKKNVNYSEYFIHQWTYYLFNYLSNTKTTNIRIHVPKIFEYDEKKKILKMQKINGDNLSNIYGEDIENVPVKIINIIRNVINILNYYSVEYLDITGYNFMLDKNEKLWIIDFGHAKCRDKNEQVDSFILQFIDGINSWNPEFK
tara:strand:- start:1520 stop:1972 length:453 start_codon:yes stop_codon:yes gene_type:complete